MSTELVVPPCPKCGYAKAELRYCSGGCGHHSLETMHALCPRCGFTQWLDPLDCTKETRDAEIASLVARDTHQRTQTPEPER